MITIKNKIESFLLEHTVWVFIIILFFLNHNWVLSSGKSGYLYLEINKWLDYFGRAIWCCLLFSPLLLFALFRKGVKKKLNTRLYWLLWTSCFILVPFLVGYFELQNLFIQPNIDGAIMWIWGAIFVAVELVLQFNDFLLKKIDLKSKVNSFGLEKFLIAGLIIFSLFYAFIKQATYDGNYISNAIQHLLFFGIFYAFYWINHYVLMSKIFRQKGIIYYGFAFIGLALIFYPIIALAINYFPVLGLKQHAGSEFWIPKATAPTDFFHVMSGTFPLLGMVISVPFIVIFQWFKQGNKIVTLEKEKSVSELNALKQQVNPHFLFNTLNSLYALGIEENAEKTADGIAKLGTLMRYNLHDAQVDQIALSKEIDYIRKYIELQELRLSDKNKLSIQIEETGMDKMTIAPMLLIPFIENAFKYGVSPSETTKIDLKIRLKKNILVLQLLNTIIKNRQQKNGNGIGISNTRQRLAKLYPEKYELIIEESANEFEVNLEIDLR